jgi:uncharacterized membrane protein (UPF0127 family)
MIVLNPQRGTVLGEAIEVAESAAQKVKGLLGRDCLLDGQGLLFKHCSSLHTFFMSFPIDIVFMNRNRKVLKVSQNVKPFHLVAAPLRAYYALELPANAIAKSQTKVGDNLTFDFEEAALDIAA